MNKASIVWDRNPFQKQRRRKFKVALMDRRGRQLRDPSKIKSDKTFNNSESAIDLKYDFTSITVRP